MNFYFETIILRENVFADSVFAFCSFSSDDQVKLEQRRQWLDSEVEKVLKRKQAMEALEEELKKRETIIRNREAMLAEKSELEMKKLRSSQVLTKVTYFFGIVLSSALDD